MNLNSHPDFIKYKEQQKPLIDKYNRQRTKKAKKKTYKQIIGFEKLIYDLDLSLRCKQ